MLGHEDGCLATSAPVQLTFGGLLQLEVGIHHEWFPINKGSESGDNIIVGAWGYLGMGVF